MSDNLMNEVEAKDKLEESIRKIGDEMNYDFQIPDAYEISIMDRSDRWNASSGQLFYQINATNPAKTEADKESYRALTQVFLSDFDPRIHRKKMANGQQLLLWKHILEVSKKMTLEDDPEKIARYANTLAKLSKAYVLLEKIQNDK